MTGADLRALADMLETCGVGDDAVVTGIFPRDDFRVITTHSGPMPRPARPGHARVAVLSDSVHWIAELTYPDEDSTLLALTKEGWTEV